MAAHGLSSRRGHLRTHSGELSRRRPRAPSSGLSRHVNRAGSPGRLPCSRRPHHVAVPTASRPNRRRPVTVSLPVVTRSIGFARAIAQKKGRFWLAGSTIRRRSPRRPRQHCCHRRRLRMTRRCRHLLPESLDRVPGRTEPCRSDPVVGTRLYAHGQPVESLRSGYDTRPQASHLVRRRVADACARHTFHVKHRCVPSEVRERRRMLCPGEGSRATPIPRAGRSSRGRSQPRPVPSTVRLHGHSDTLVVYGPTIYRPPPSPHHEERSPFPGGRWGGEG